METGKNLNCLQPQVLKKKKKGEGRWEQEKKRHIKMHHDAEELQQASGINDQRRQQSPMDQICNIFQK